jgi:hypothetical protein
VIYVAVSLGVFGTLTVKEVIASGGTALAVAAEPTLGRAGYWLMSVTALFATSGATNAGLFPATGLSENMVEIGQWPTVFAARLAGRAPVGLVVTAAVAIVLAVGFDLSAIASIGSAVALAVFMFITVAHLRVRAETGASPAILWLALLTAAVALVSFIFTSLIHEPASMVTLGVIVVASVVADAWWKARRPSPVSG